MKHYKKREQQNIPPVVIAPPVESKQEKLFMRITEQERSATVIILSAAPAGQNLIKVKRKAIAEGNINWLRARQFIDGDFNFTKEAEAAGIVKAKVLINTSEFGRGVKGQIMYLPTKGEGLLANAPRFKGDFEL